MWGVPLLTLQVLGERTPDYNLIYNMNYSRMTMAMVTNMVKPIDGNIETLYQTQSNMKLCYTRERMIV